ncbi:MAG: hypothetical protein ACI8RD_011288 [Bacillariaceae sp.]|jgi:hypothetical protein
MEDDELDDSSTGIIEVELEPERLHDGAGGNRRQSMSHKEEKERRASIKAILADDSITPHERRRSIQNLMDGRRSSIGTASIASMSSGGSVDLYGYGEGSPDGYQEELDSNNNNNSDDENENANGATFCIPVSNENTKRAELTRPPCNHYDRNCTLIAPCCGAAFGCRICHDDSPILPPLLIAKRSSRRSTRSSSMPGGFTSMEDSTHRDTHHTIDRFLVSEIICRECYTKQSSKTYDTYINLFIFVNKKIMDMKMFMVMAMVMVGQCRKLTSSLFYFLSPLF